jgi:hypothetical protein
MLHGINIIIFDLPDAGKGFTALCGPYNNSVVGQIANFISKAKTIFQKVHQLIHGNQFCSWLSVLTMIVFWNTLAEQFNSVHYYLNC